MGLRGERLAVTVMLLGKTASFTALRDTGSGLRDSTGTPILTVERRCLPQLPRELERLPAAEALPLLRRLEPALCPQLLPVRTAAAGACCSPCSATGRTLTDSAAPACESP